MAARIIIFLFLALPTGLVAIKIFFLGYSPKLLLPEKGYHVSIEMTGNSDQENTRIASFIPSDTFRQKISQVSYVASGFEFVTVKDGLNQKAQWQAFDPTGPFKVSYRFSVSPKAVEWKIPKDLSIPKVTSPDLLPYLESTELVPLKAPEMIALHKELIGEERNLLTVVQKSYDYVSGLKTLSFKGSTNAITAILLGQASCNGKSHLLAGLLRSSGIPVRLVSGLVLEPGKKRISHQWIEARIKDQWVTFDPTNKHFAKIPAHYLVVYYDTAKFFSHSKSIGFNWTFDMESFLMPPTEIFHIKSDAFNFLKLYALFSKEDLSMSLLKILLMIPVGGLIATFFRNVIGTQTFGTFLPALIAAASYQTGVWWGLLGFSVVIFALALVRLLFEQLDLMHTPKLSAMLTIVVIMVLGISVVSAEYTDLRLERIILFPIAILTLTTERFSITIEEKGILKALWILLQTLFVTLICYLFMSNLFLQVSFLAFPELSLALIGLNLVLGRWVGIRMTELFRFRRVIFEK